MFDFDDALEAGAAYAFYRHGQDVQTDQITEAIRQHQPAPAGDVHVNVNVRSPDEDDPDAPLINALDFTRAEMPQSWDEYIGQAPLKQQLQVRIKAAQARGEALPHTLLASGMPGIGKTTMARLIAKTLGVEIIEVVPPFNMHTLLAAAEQLLDNDILFIDEIHLLALKRRGTEILLKVLEDKVAYLPDGNVVPLNDITIIGATTEKDLLPETIVDRFKIKPYFQPYTEDELEQITVRFAIRHDAVDSLTSDLVVAIADACRGTPRLSEEMVMAAHDLALSEGRPSSPDELLRFIEMEPDGLTRTHVQYLTVLRQYYASVRGRGEDKHVEYVAGENTLMNILRENRQGIGRIERFLMELGLIDRPTYGRRLTGRGTARAEQLIAQGKGANDVS